MCLLDAGEGVVVSPRGIRETHMRKIAAAAREVQFPVPGTVGRARSRGKGTKGVSV
jgi:hypothetical protein